MQFDYAVALLNKPTKKKVGKTGMLNQSFSIENFRKIIDIENRKGVFLEGKFFPSLKTITDEIKVCNKDIASKKRDRSISTDKLKEIYDQRRALKERKESQLTAELQKISEKVVATDFKIALVKKDIPGQKSLYLVKDSPEHYFAIKQLQINMARLFGVKQSNRFDIVSQVKVLLSDGFPKYVLRTDIADFYESIPHASLLEKINGNNLLTYFSRKIIRQILTEYKTLSGNDAGIPRGVGISAYLAELYMRDVDRLIMSLKGISYYARYVDDIIIIFTPFVDEKPRDYRKDIADIVEGRFKLKLNVNKTIGFDLRCSGQQCEMEYLGYKIFFGNGKLKTRLTQKKVEKYKRRIDASFEHYSNLSKVNEKEARKLLVRRIRFLTGNTRLKNNKNNVLVGIYHSNIQLTELDDLVSLDDYLRNKINLIQADPLQIRLRKFGFKAGFDERVFHPFKTHELQKIMKAWKHDTL